ncbi:MAG: ARMT1-like domain-containing protein [Methanobrevibacter sp.]|jgi:uncharacterized protein with ATP-grasp and redox domains|nr:ARMT1-like domain-containing protein [Methanobrevibacter sp.]
MKVYYECGACLLRQSKEAMNLASDDANLKLEITEEIFKYLSNSFKQGASSNKLGTDIHRIIKEKTNNPDPYKNEKKLGNKIAIELEEKFKKILKKDDSLENYVKISIIGNILDFGALGINTDLKKLINSSANKKLRINHVNNLKKSLAKSKSLLYLADNTGEIIYDKLLIKKLIEDYNLKITFAVKEKPILNDACVENAKLIGLDKITNLTTTGTDSIGIVYDYLSKDFKEIFEKENLIISKGMGNYEGLTELNSLNKDVFCLLSAKCSAIAKDLGVEENDMVVIKLFSK